MENQFLIPLGDGHISAVLHKPAKTFGGKSPIVVICHGFISNKTGQHRLFVQTARELAANGFAVLRFDYGGCGESSGEYSEITLPDQVAETIKVLDFISRDPQLDSENIILLGHSFGGAVATLTAARDNRIGRLVLWSPVAVPQADIVGIIGYDLYRQGLSGKNVHFQGFVLGRNFLLSLAQLSPLDEIKKFSGSVLIVHGDSDTETPLRNARLYKRALRHRAGGTQEIRVIKNADHTYSLPLCKKSAISATVHWLRSAVDTFSGNSTAIIGY